MSDSAAICDLLRVAIVFSTLPFAALIHSAGARADEVPGAAAEACPGSDDAWFAEEVWAKIGAVHCVKCHKASGDAEDTRFRLHDLALARPEARGKLQRQNRRAFAQMAEVDAGGRPLLLVKAQGGLDHGGQTVLKPGSPGARILEQFVERLRRPGRPADDAELAGSADADFFAGVTLVPDTILLRRATLSLAGRLPTPDERRAVAAGGLPALASVLDQVMREDAFYDRLREAFNDIFLTLGVNGNPDSTVLSYEHFEKTRLWYQKYDLSHIEDEDARRRAGYQLANDYRAALLGEPMKLVEHIVRNDRPFSEILTADYIMVSPFTARGYGIFDLVKERFRDPEDPFEYLPVKLKALVGRSRREDQLSPTGDYPHAGLLSTFQYLSRYGTTETNRNRLRARMYYQHFLGVDVLELAARVSDAAAVTAKYEIPTMQASECVVCHKTLDPVAGLFQEYWRFDANFSIYGRRQEGWFDDMFAAGFEGETLPDEERWRALQWLGERTVKDPRFAVAMVEHAYYLLTGRRPLLPPQNLKDPLDAARRRAYREQRQTVEAIAAAFVESNFNFKTALKLWVLSKFYRADGLAVVAASPRRQAELEDLGVVRLLSPEQLERKIAAVFGQRWGRLTEQTAMLYGGIDSQEVTARASDPSGAMGAIQRTLANDVACRNVALDFSRPKGERRLFPDIEPGVLPGSSDDADARIRRAIAELHQRILGRDDPADSAEVARTFQLFSGVVADAARQTGLDDRENYHCRQGLRAPVPDPHYTVRAWRAVVTYLLRRSEFLYE